jgi:hypothetical protein
LPNIISVIVIAFVLAASIVNLNDEAYTRNVSSSSSNNSDNVPLLDAKDSSNKSTSSLESRDDGKVDNSDPLHVPEKRSAHHMYSLCQEMVWITNVIIGWIIGYAPVCVGFLVALSLATAGGLVELIESVGIYCLSTIFGLIIHISLSLPALYYFFTGENPYHYLFECRQAVIVAFSTASSVSTAFVKLSSCLIYNYVSSANCVIYPGGNFARDYWLRCGLEACSALHCKRRTAHGSQCEHGRHCNRVSMHDSIPCLLGAY